MTAEDVKMFVYSEARKLIDIMQEDIRELELTDTQKWLVTHRIVNLIFSRFTKINYSLALGKEEELSNKEASRA